MFLILAMLGIIIFILILNNIDYENTPVVFFITILYILFLVIFQIGVKQ